MSYVIYDKVNNEFIGRGNCHYEDAVSDRDKLIDSNPSYGVKDFPVFLECDNSIEYSVLRHDVQRFYKRLLDIHLVLNADISDEDKPEKISKILNRWD